MVRLRKRAALRPAPARDAALLLLVSHGTLDEQSLVSLSGSCKLIQSDAYAVLGQLESMTIEWDVPVEGTGPLCGALAQLRGDLVLDGTECKYGKGVKLPRAASIRRLFLANFSSAALPTSFAAWPQLESVDWYDSSLLTPDHAAFVDLVASAPSLKSPTLTLTAYCDVNDVDLLNSLSRLCDKLTVCRVTLEMADSGGGRIPACSVLHKCPAWESMAAAHGIMGSNKLLLGANFMTRGHLADWFNGAVSAAQGTQRLWASPDWLDWHHDDSRTVYDPDDSDG